MRDTKTYHFCIHCYSMPLWENFVLFILFIYPATFCASALSCYGYSNTCGVLEQTFKYVSFTKFKIRDFIMSQTSGLRDFEHILWTILSRCSILYFDFEQGILSPSLDCRLVRGLTSKQGRPNPSSPFLLTSSGNNKAPYQSTILRVTADSLLN